MPEPPPVSRFDVVVITDLRFPGGTSTSLAEELTAAAGAGYSIGILHVASPRLGSSVGVNPRLRRLLDDDTVQLLVPGEPVRAHLVIVKHPMCFAEPLGGPLPIDAEHVLLTAGQVPADEAHVYYTPSYVDDHILEALGRRATWAPVSPTVRSTLHGVELDPDDWTEVIDVDHWRRPEGGPSADAGVPAPEISDDGDPDTEPLLVIGRHSRPDRLKWPDDPRTLRAVYPTDGTVRVRVLGGADAVADVLGEVPAAWEVLPFGAVDPRDFLAGLDAFVYFHHPDLTEAFGRTVLEALAVGIPVVVPDHFRPIFGSTCLYADPADALHTVRALLADPDRLAAHLDEVERAIRERHGHDTHRTRLARLIGEPVPTTGARAVPSLDLAPHGLRGSYTTTLVSCLGASADEVEAVLEALDHHRRRAPGFIPLVVTTITRPAAATRLGIETRVISSRRGWDHPSEEWIDYAQRRLRQLSAHYRVDNVAVADPLHADAWIALQLRRSSRN